MLVEFVHIKEESLVLNMGFETDEVQVGRFNVSVIKDDQYIGGCLRRGHEWDGWMRQDLPHIYKPGTEILDIGGNIGWNALMFSDYGPVHTFEPLFHEVISKNVSQNTLKNPVNVHPVALSSEDGESPIWVIKKTEEGLCNYGSATITRGAPHDSYGDAWTHVPNKRLDDVYTGNASVIKLDVEGHELEVLKGGLETIKRTLPAMYIEIIHKRDDAIINLLKPLGYDTIIPRPENNFLFISSNRS